MPAFMRLAGRANWWAPAPLRRLYDRFGLREEILAAATRLLAETGRASCRERVYSNV